jgi:hypothetical protein
MVITKVVNSYRVKEQIKSLEEAIPKHERQIEQAKAAIVKWGFIVPKIMVDATLDYCDKMDRQIKSAKNNIKMKRSLLNETDHLSGS